MSEENALAQKRLDIRFVQAAPEDDVSDQKSGTEFFINQTHYRPKIRRPAKIESTSCELRSRFFVTNFGPFVG